MNPLAMLSDGFPVAKPPEGDELTKMCHDQQTDDVNEEWENVLKDKMPEEINDIMDAICQRLSKDGVLNACTDDGDTDTVNLIAYMTTEIEKHIFSLFGGSQPDILTFLLNYVPPLSKLTQSGGNETPSLTNAVGGLAAKAVENNPTVMAAKLGANAASSVATGAVGAASNVATGAVGAVSNLTTGVLGAVGNAASGAAEFENGNMFESPMSGAVDPTKDGISAATDVLSTTPIQTPTPESLALTNQGQPDAAKPTRKKELTDGKAETILNLYTNHIINQIKCNSDTAQILQTKIIDTMIISITDNLNINSLELFSELAKETTVRCMKDRISLITPTMEVYKNIISTATATATATEEILPDYIRLLLELFVYREYAQLLNDADIELNIDELTTLITTHRKALKPVRESAKKIMANTNEGMVQAIQNLNGFPRPNGGTEVDTIAVPSSNNQNALAKFKALFEEETEETKGGGRKKHTRKHKRHHKKRRSTRRYR